MKLFNKIFLQDAEIKFPAITKKYFQAENMKRNFVLMAEIGNQN